jgi:hypothetical protein
VTSSVSLSLIAKDCSCYAANKHTMQPHHLNSRTCSVTSSASLSLIAKDCSCYTTERTMQPHHLTAAPAA